VARATERNANDRLALTTVHGALLHAVRLAAMTNRFERLSAQVLRFADHFTVVMAAVAVIVVMIVTNVIRHRDSADGESKGKGRNNQTLHLRLQS